MQEFKKVKCPACGRTVSHYLGGVGAVYRNVCPKCHATFIIYSAGRTAVFNAELKIEIEIKF